MRVEVQAEEGGALPGVTIRFSQPNAGTPFEYHTDAHGTVTTRLESGSWRVDAVLSGFRTGHYILELAGDRACSIKFRLSIDGNAAITVT